MTTRELSAPVCQIHQIVIPAQAGIQTIYESPREVGQDLDQGFVRYAGCLMSWIPACAGMTVAFRYLT
jgi:hypothetical protein